LNELNSGLNCLALLRIAMHARDKVDTDSKNAQILFMGAVLVVGRANLKYAQRVHERFKKDMLAVF